MMKSVSELQKRVITGVLGAGLLISLIVFARLVGVFLVTTIISLGMVYEYTEITLNLPDRLEKRYVLLLLTWMCALLNLFIPQVEFSLLVFSFILLFCYFLFTAKRYKERQFTVHFYELAYSFFGIVYLVFFPLFLLRIYKLPFGPQWTLLFFLVVWTSDTVAYFVGKKFGRTKLYPEVSPKKTFEGAFGGLLGSLIITVGFKLIGFPQMSWLAAFIIPFVVGGVSQVGDLCESFFKRAFDKKDAGTILPGHGGLLDRFDGVVFSLPVMYLCIWVL